MTIMNDWDAFFKEKITVIIAENKTILDIGGGLRVSKKSGNRYDPSREWIVPLLERAKYKIMDPVPDYAPDIVGDIHQIPLKDDSEDVIICLAVLEHVENPFQAVKEMHRVLKAGGSCFVYVPFLYYYHAQTGYYKDYWRFTKDALPLLFKDFSKMEISSVRGSIGTWLHLSPFGGISIVVNLGQRLDRLFGKIKSNQVSGYYVFLIK